MIYTTIIHPVRKFLDITPYDYMLLDIIAKSQGNERYSTDGWCTLSYNTIANYIGVSGRGLKKSAAKMEGMKLLEIGFGSKKRVSNLWYEAFEMVNKVPQNKHGEQSSPVNKVPQSGEQSSPEVVNKVPENGEQSSLHNIKKKFKDNSKGNLAQNSKSDMEIDAENLRGVNGNFEINKPASEEKKKVAPKKKARELVLFSETEFYADFDLFFSRFEVSEYKDADLRYYFECVKNWADGKGERRKDWIAVARQFMLRDRRDGKLVLNSKNKNVDGNGKTKAKGGTRASIVDVEQARRIAGL